MKPSMNSVLKASSAAFVIGAVLLSTPVFAKAEDAAAAAAAPDTPAPSKGDDNVIIVTGTIIHNKIATASPITRLTSDDLTTRGISTFQGLLQTLASNNGPALGNSFTANGAFAGGASAVSLRGLTTNSSLVLFNGLRAAYYPLADDGVRNFVDLNTIPDEIVDTVDVYRDSASSAYGADAVAGVINIRTKPSFKGLDATVEAGATGRGDNANQRIQAIAGIGDLATQGWNFYVAGHYIHQDELRNSSLGSPYNSDDQSAICYQGNCGLDNRQNAPGAGFTGISTIAPVLLVRPYDAANKTPQGRYQFLNPATGCGGLSSYTLTAAQSAQFTNAPATVCTSDSVRQGGIVEPRQERLGAAARFSVNIGADLHAYVEGNFEQSRSSYSGYGLAGVGTPTNTIIRASAPAGIVYPTYSTSSAAAPHVAGSGPLTLPIYVCPIATVGACNAQNGTLNPNNPFAAQGEVARLIGELPNEQQFTTERNRSYRVAAGINGTFGDRWSFKLDGTINLERLQETNEGYVYIQHLLDVVKDGSYNFVNPSANSAAEINYLTPKLTQHDKSGEYQVAGSLTKALFDLPGGPLQIAAGGSWRRETIDSPSGNPDYNGPTQRYFVLNAFGTVGKRDVEAGYFEVDAPVLKILLLEGSGRYDHYSTGASHFSPKGGVIFSPVKQLTLRGSIAGGFRIPSFAESSSLPTTGYVTFPAGNFPAAYLAQFSNGNGPCAAATPSNCSTYVTQATVGETTISNPNLKPETTRNFDIGADFKPFKGFLFKVDYYNIRKRNAITPAAFSAAINAYYAGTPLPAGYVIIPDAPDINTPNALPRISQVESPFINANTISTDGIDMSLSFTHTFANNWTLSVEGEAEYIHKLNTSFPDGHTEHYAGTLGNFNLTAGTGTPQWKATLQPTLDFNKKFALSTTIYYTAGYNLSAEDQGNVAGDCGQDIANGSIQACDVKRFIDVDATASFKVGDRFTFYVNVLNVFDAKPPLDTITYGGYLYNPVVAEAGIIGRAFRVGAKVHL